MKRPALKATNRSKRREILEGLPEFASQCVSLSPEAVAHIQDLAQAGQEILFEAQLGALRDIHFGIYPYTSSSCCLAAFAPIGGGLFARRPDYVLGVMKAFSTCVGEGPFVTEMAGEEAKEVREIAGEYGAATGRPRRIGHFDAFASRYGLQIQGADEVALTKLDCLTSMDSLLICTHYEYKGKRVDQFPLNAVLEACRPVYQEMAGWSEDISAVRHFPDLPEAAQAYVREIERLVARPIRYISVGAERECLIDRG